MRRLIFVLFFLLFSIGVFIRAKFSQDTEDDGDEAPRLEPSDGSDENDEQVMEPAKIAFCLTGQLARLELLSKVSNIFLHNAYLGHTTHVYVLLDSDVDEVKQTFWKYDYSDSLYATYSASKLENYMNRKADGAGVSDLFRARVRLEAPAQNDFQIVGNKIPVEDKVINNANRHHEKDHGAVKKNGFEPAASRFQNNMRWLAGLRDCVKWVQHEEYRLGIFYDLVVRLRDDTLAFGPWELSKERYGGALTSANTGSFRGINDHNFVIDREWADTLFRGLTEDYYFNKTLSQEMWGNPEHRIYMLASANNIPIQTTTICQQPLVPLRGKYNKTHWLVHPSYTDKFIDECEDPETWKIEDCHCSQQWIDMFTSGVISFDLGAKNDL